MTLIEVEGAAGPPWERTLAGVLDRLTVQSELLASNPHGDPTRRPLYVYRPPDAGHDLTTVYVLQGYTGQLDMWLSHSALELNYIERLDALFAAGSCPPALVVFVDAWTTLGGSQFLNSPSTGRYLDYLCDEIVPFVDVRYPTVPHPGRRAVAGHSSGGYGAMVAPMLRPDVFGALASHAGDALFECCYLPEFPKVARRLRDDFGGSIEVMRERLEQEPRFDFARYGDALSMYAYACAYSPDPARPGEALLPFDTRTGRTIPEVWARWLEHDPVRMAETHSEALRGLRHIHVDAGRSDEYNLDLGAQAFSDELHRLGVAHTFELFDGRHGGNSWRYPDTIRALATALA